MPTDFSKTFFPDPGTSWIKKFFDFDIAKFEGHLKKEDESFWSRAGERRALALFHAAARQVPAYRDFLRRNRIRHDRIRTVADFAHVPPTDKTNYIAAYPLQERCWGGRLDQSSLIAMSSGTSGEPKFWPRGGYEEFEAAVIHELAYRALFDIQRKKTLVLIGFPMGVYVSGVATLLPSWLVSQRGYDLTVVSVGNNKAEKLRMAQHLAAHYDQTVLVGHPFFVKDVIETARRQKIKLPKNLKLMFCSEGFSEEWRQYVMQRAHIEPDACHAISTYGSSETLLIGHETPASIALRRTMGPLAPSVFQYNPLLRYIETAGNELLFTSASGIPLIRFNLHDSGQIISHQAARETASLPRGSWKLPFVTLSGRSDHTMIFYAANIYPEHIHLALNEKKFLRDITGKFAMRKDYLKNMDEFLEINIELQQDTPASPILARTLEDHIVKRLDEVNIEYRFLLAHLEKDLRPRVVLRPYQDPAHFKPGLKPKYIVK
jgi:phenylacetate-CoA ligase